MNGVRITHIGGPTALIEVEGWRLLTDPTFDASRPKVLLRLRHVVTKAGRTGHSAADLPPIDAVLLTHDHHGDNLDPSGRALLPSAGVVVTTARAREGANGHP